MTTVSLYDGHQQCSVHSSLENNVLAFKCDAEGMIHGQPPVEDARPGSSPEPGMGLLRSILFAIPFYGKHWCVCFT
jgi:hypothetical protein